ncbi:MAG: ABC transporter ATP-binding protein [Acutalibacteraceae bacterium]
MKEIIYKKLRVNSLSEIKEELLWVKKYIKKYWKIIVVYFVLGLVSSAMTIGGSVLSKMLIDTVTGYQTSSILTVAVMYAVFGIVSILMTSVSSRISAKYSTKVTNEMQYDIYRESLNVEWQYLKKFHTGDLINRVSNDVSTVSNSILTWVPNFIIKAIQALTCVAIILYYDPVMALISIISTPVMALLSRKLMSKIRLFSKKSREASSRIMSFIQESYNNVQSVKAFGIVDDFNLRFKMIQEDYYSVIMEQNKFSIMTGALMSSIGMLVSYSCYGWGIYRLWSGFITFGTMTMFLQLASYLSNSFSSLVSMVPSAINSLTAIRRLIDIVGLPKEPQDSRVNAKTIKKEADGGISINIKDGRFVYDDKDEIFTCLSFSARPGEVSAIVGPSGSGKTTIFRILLGIAGIKSGKCEICYSHGGEEIHHDISASTRGLFAYVPQGNAVFYGTVAENMRLFNKNATDEEIVDSLKAACAYDFVSRLDGGINAIVEEGGGNFSEGQKQRLCIARALVSGAPVVLLDEGTSALDKDTERELLKNLTKYKKDKTFIISTHRTSVLDICDRTYKIKDKTLEVIKNQSNV